MDFNFNTINSVIEGVFTLEEAKAVLLKEDQNIQYQLLSPTDWTVTRLQETGTAIPVNISDYRTLIRATGNLRKEKINACADLDALKTLLLTPQTQQADDGLVIGNPGSLDIWLLPDQSNSLEA